ncbi:alpha/beta-Hydrolases superfamily protein [Perilla frutescens var. frutescens]|nr:alpha/beta-Hydrolases superfamily protein [Perilla frutescens var. frutescens]
MYAWIKIRCNELIYQENPRLKTALEMLRTSMSLEESLNEVTLPFFVLHGESDTVTDPEVSRALYERVSSVDRTLNLYPDMWHGLTAGEPDDNIEVVFSDIISWLDKHVAEYCLTDLDHVPNGSAAMAHLSQRPNKSPLERVRE